MVMLLDEDDGLGCAGLITFSLLLVGGEGILGVEQAKTCSSSMLIVENPFLHWLQYIRVLATSSSSSSSSSSEVKRGIEGAVGPTGALEEGAVLELGAGLGLLGTSSVVPSTWLIRPKQSKQSSVPSSC